MHLLQRAWCRAGRLTQCPFIFSDKHGVTVGHIAWCFAQAAEAATLATAHEDVAGAHSEQAAAAAAVDPDERQPEAGARVHGSTAKREAAAGHTDACDAMSCV